MKFVTSYILAIIFCLASLSGYSGEKKKKNGGTQLTEKQVIELKSTFFEANKEKMLGNNQKAIQLFQKCIALNTNHSASYYELASIKVQLKQYADARGYLEKACELDPENKWYLQSLAYLYENLKEYDEAIKVYEDLIDQHPKELTYYEGLANMYIFKNDLKGATKVYNRSEAQFGVMEFSSSQKQKIYVSQGKIDKAIEEAQKLIEAAPSTPRYYTDLAELYSKNGQQEKAIETYQHLLEIDPNNAYVQLSMSVYYFEGGDYEKAKSTMRDAFKNPELEFNSKVRILFNDIAYRNAPPGKINPFGFELAEILCEVHDDNPKSYAILADLNYQSGNKKEALKAYEQSLEVDQNQFLVWSQVLILYSENNQWDSIYSGSNRALEYFPNQPSIYFFKGVACIQIKEYEEAVEALETGKDFVVDNNGLLGQFYSNLADAYHNLDEHVKSDRYFDKALVLDPEDDLVLNNYSYYLSLRGDKLERAAEMAKMVVERNPKSATYLDTYAWVLYKKGEYEEAKEVMEKALFHGGDSEGVLLEHYGDILFKLSDKEQALIYWQKAKNQGGGTDLLEKKINSQELFE